MEQTPNFDKILNSNIIFAVIVAVVLFKIRSIDYNSKDYFMLVQKTDAKKLKKLKIRFKKCSEYSNLIEVKMTSDDVMIFKLNQDKFKKVISDTTGRVYELKDNPFKKLLTK